MLTAKIRMRKPQRVFSLLCDDVSIARDDACVVRTDRGIELGVCVLPPEPCRDDVASRYSMRVLRKMTDEDVKTREHLTKEEEHARALCQKKIRSRNMPMKLVDVEYTFDKHKIIFYFTADDRVDFREIVRDLAHELRTRIEMRHIQVRDEAKVVGGIGSCGRALCCTTFLNEFKPISMRMAKRQNLSLNPSKISGQCGRLLCCLSYENDQYETMKRRSKPAAKANASENAERAGSGDQKASKGREGQRDGKDGKGRGGQRDQKESGGREGRRDRNESRGRGKSGDMRGPSKESSRRRDAVQETARVETPAAPENLDAGVELAPVAEIKVETKVNVAPENLDAGMEIAPVAEVAAKVVPEAKPAQPVAETASAPAVQEASVEKVAVEKVAPVEEEAADAVQASPPKQEGRSRRDKHKRRQKKQRGGKKSGGAGKS